MKNNITVILRMTNACNLACTYCYDRLKRKYCEDINEKFLNNIDKIANYIESFYINKDRKMNLILHGGEPLTLNSEVYDIFLRKITEKIKNISISIQTNGTLLNEEKIKILNKYNVKIGISLDGCDEEQNRNRIYKNGKNSFSKVKQTIDILNKSNTKFGIIMTLSKSNLNKEKEIYEFIKENNIYCDIRPAFPTKQTIEDNNLMTNDEYVEFFIRLFDIWYEDKTNKVKLKQINEIYDEFVKVLEPKLYRPCCENSESCFGKFISLDVDGNIYTCNRTYNEFTFFLGNLNQNSVQEILENSNKLYIQRKNRINNSKCMKCEIFKYCHGGCPASSYYLYGDFSQPYVYSCKQRKEIYAYVKNKLEGQIIEYNNGKRRKYL